MNMPLRSLDFKRFLKMFIPLCKEGGGWISSKRGVGQIIFVIGLIKKCWLGLREVTGDDDYERYLEHWREHHALDGGKPLDRKTYFKQELERKWSGVRRCC